MINPWGRTWYRWARVAIFFLALVASAAGLWSEPEESPDLIRRYDGPVQETIQAQTYEVYQVQNEKRLHDCSLSSGYPIDRSALSQSPLPLIPGLASGNTADAHNPHKFGRRC